MMPLFLSSIDCTGVEFGFQISAKKKSRGFKSDERAAGALHPRPIQPPGSFLVRHEALRDSNLEPFMTMHIEEHIFQ
jgi:hypothetical protein